MLEYARLIAGLCVEAYRFIERVVRVRWVMVPVYLLVCASAFLLIRGIGTDRDMWTGTGADAFAHKLNELLRLDTNGTFTSYDINTDATGNSSPGNPGGFVVFPLGAQAATPNDFNADAHSDLLWRHSGGTTVLWEMDGGNKLLEDKIATAVTYVDPKKRQEAWAEIQQMVANEIPWVFLWQQHDLYGVANWIDWSPRADEKVWMYDAKIAKR